MEVIFKIISYNTQFESSYQIKTGNIKGHVCLRRLFSLVAKIWSESFDFALSLLLTYEVYMKTNIIICDRQWFT